MAVDVAASRADQEAPSAQGALARVAAVPAWVWLAGIVAYGISTLLNVTIFARLKGSEGSRLLWFRSAVASVLSQIVDTLLFITIAFYGVFPIAELLMGQMLAKVVLSIIMVPPLIYLMVAIGRRLDSRA